MITKQPITKTRGNKQQQFSIARRQESEIDYASDDEDVTAAVDTTVARRATTTGISGDSRAALFSLPVLLLFDGNVPHASGTRCRRSGWNAATSQTIYSLFVLP
jgi:hypothetical protein